MKTYNLKTLKASSYRAITHKKIENKFLQSHNLFVMIRNLWLIMATHCIFLSPCWCLLVLNYSETVKAVTLAFCRFSTVHEKHSCQIEISPRSCMRRLRDASEMHPYRLGKLSVGICTVVKPLVNYGTFAWNPILKYPMKIIENMHRRASKQIQRNIERIWLT